MRCAKQEAGFARVEASKCSKKDMESFTFATIFVRDDGFSLSRATCVCSQVESAVTAGFEKRNLLGCPVLGLCICSYTITCFAAV